MNSLTLLTAEAATMAGGWTTIILYLVIFGVALYFLIIRPQKKQQKQQDELMSSLEIGDSVLTTSGFYGVCISMVDDNVIIVEFGNNKNCRIPMKKTAIVEVEKPYSAQQAAKKEAEAAPEKKGLFAGIGKKKEEKEK